MTTSTPEQNLLESLIIESISIYGNAMYYVPRVIKKLDKIYTADDQSEYNTPYSVPIYIESFDRFQGDGNFLSKFGLEIRNQIVLSIAQRVFSSIVPQDRPNEGDVIYFPLNDNVFQIKYVEKFEMFYPLGKLYIWKMTCELFEYSNEKFNTGIPAIDKIQTYESTDILDYGISTEDEIYISDEKGHYITVENYDLDEILDTGTNEVFQDEIEDFVDWSSESIFGSIEEEH